MPGSLYNKQNVVKGMAMLYVAPWTDSLTFPSDDTPLFAPDNAGWSSTWAAAGASDEGYKLTIDSSTQTENIEEDPQPVSVDLEGREIKIEAALAEDTLETIKLAVGGGSIAVQAASSTVVGKRTLTLNDSIDRVAAVLEMKNKFGLARRWIIPEMMAGGSVSTDFRRAAGKRLYPLALQAVCATADIRCVDITAPKTA